MASSAAVVACPVFPAAVVAFLGHLLVVAGGFQARLSAAAVDFPARSGRLVAVAFLGLKLAVRLFRMARLSGRWSVPWVR